MAYLLPVLQHLKLAELNDAKFGARPSLSTERQPRRALNPRALILSPTHELSRQLSGFAKMLSHVVKLRVMCGSQANIQNTSKHRLTASKMSALFDTENEALSTDLAVRKTSMSRPVDVFVGTPPKILELVRGRGWNVDDAPFRHNNSTGGPSRRGRLPVNESEMGLADVEWVVVDEADILFGKSTSITTLTKIETSSE